MGNRIIKESICTSDSIDQLSWFEECFFNRLLVNADDFGRMDARVQILKARLFPLKDTTDKQIKDALNKLSTVGIVQVYEYDQKPYLQFVTWERHQRIRNKRGKYPNAIGEYDSQELGIKSNSGQPLSIDSEFTTDDGLIQSNTNPIQSEYESEYELSIMPGAETAPDSNNEPPPVIELMLNDKSMHPIAQKDITQWAELYPAVDILQELRNMKGWINSNPQRRKTKSGINRFITNWLSKAQNQGGAKHGANVGNNGTNTGENKKPQYGTVL